MRRPGIPIAPLARFLTASWLAVFLLAANAHPDTMSSTERPPTSLSLGLDLLREAAEEDTANIVLSPLSIDTALSLLAQGARGSTQQEIVELLAGPGRSATFVADRARRRTDNAGGKEGVELSLANLIWVRPGMVLKPAFTEAAESMLVTAISHEAPARAAAAINAWAERATRGKIPQVVERINEDDPLLLANAVYFKGAWHAPFDPAGTRQGLFRRGRDDTLEIPFMAQWGDFDYFEDAHVQFIRLPYAASGVAMYLLLPSARTDLSDWLAGLGDELWSGWVRKLDEREGQLQLPRFSASFDADLAPALQRLGVARVFDAEHADLGDMVTRNQGLFAAGVKHVTVLEVTEKGTEAAAVTSVPLVGSLPPTAPPFRMIVDRPFVFAIIDDNTGTVLFLGAIRDPRPLE